MQVVILAAIIVTLSPIRSLPLELPRGAALLAAGLYVVLSAGLAMAAGRAAARGALPGASRRWRRLHNLLGMLTHLWLVLGLAGLTCVGYTANVDYTLAATGLHTRGFDLRLSDLPLLPEILYLLPFLLALAAVWMLEYPVHRLMRLRNATSAFDAPKVWTFRQYLGYNVRHQLLFVVTPVALILLLTRLIERFIVPNLSDALKDYMLPPLMAATSLAVFVAAPLLIVRIWRTKPLPTGPLRSELQGVLTRLKLRYRDILVWQSDGVIVNAGVMGLVGQARYVLLTDALLDNMDARHLKAIFAHEVGHIAKHHIFYSALFVLVVVGAAFLLSDSLEAALGPWGAQMGSLGILGALWWLAFGWISRRFERQSDVIGACASAAEPLQDSVARRESLPAASGNGTSVDAPPASDYLSPRVTPEGSALFASALARVAQLNGIPSNQPNWRHGTIESRINYILYLGSTGGSRERIDRTVRRIKLGLWLALALVVAAIALKLTIA